MSERRDHTGFEEELKLPSEEIKGLESPSSSVDTDDRAPDGGTERSKQEEPDSTDIAQKAGELKELTDYVRQMNFGGTGRVKDVALAQELAYQIKPYIDRLKHLEQILASLREVTSEVEELDHLRYDLIQDIEEIEQIRLEGELGDEIRQRMMEIRERVTTGIGVPEVPVLRSLETLEDLSPEKKARHVFERRFIDVAEVAEVLGVEIRSEEAAKYYDMLDQLFESFFLQKEISGVAPTKRVLETLKQGFSKYILIFRCPSIGVKEGTYTSVSCTMESLMRCFPHYFRLSKGKKAWYESLVFFTEPIEEPHWAILGTEYLDCTFREPTQKLSAYAQRNAFAPNLVKQKRAVEEIYDRVVVREALKIDPFEKRCNSCTRTFYRKSSRTKRGGGARSAEG